MTNEVKQAISEKATQFWKSQSNRDHHSKMMLGKNAGAKHGRYRPFTLVASLPDGETTEYIFEGDCPSMDCVEELGLSSTSIALMRNGGTYEVRRRRVSTKHEWPLGTTVIQKAE